MATKKNSVRTSDLKHKVVERHVLEKTSMIPAPVMGVAKKVSAFLVENHVQHAIAAMRTTPAVETQSPFARFSGRGDNPLVIPS